MKNKKNLPPKYFFIDEMFYFIKNENINKEKLIRTLCIKPQSYIAWVFSRLFDYYFSDSVNIVLEYKSFYKKEFDSLDHYLKDKHNLRTAERRIMGCRKSFYKNLGMEPERNIQSLSEDKTVGAIFWALLGEKYED